VVQTFKLLLKNLSLNLQQSDEVETSSISVFNLVCKIYEFREQYECLASLDWKLDLKALCPFNFHLLEPVRYSYNYLIYKSLQTKEHQL